MAEAPLTKEQVDAIKQGIIALVESGQAPEDLQGHLADMGIESPEELLTTHLPEGHWEMMQEKWLTSPESPEVADMEQMSEADAEEPVSAPAGPRMSLPDGFQPVARSSRLVGLEKAGEDYDLAKNCMMHKRMCKVGESCPKCKMCSLYENQY